MALTGTPSYTALMSAPTDPSPPADQPDPRIELLRRALELAGVEPLVAASLAQEHYGRITMQGDRFEVSDQEGTRTTCHSPARTRSSTWRNG